MFIKDLFANAVDFVIFLGFVELVVISLLLILLIRFLWIVPNELREIRGYLRKFYNRDDLCKTDVSRLDPSVVSHVQHRVQDDFENSSTLR